MPQLIKQDRCTCIFHNSLNRFCRSAAHLTHRRTQPDDSADPDMLSAKKYRRHIQTVMQTCKIPWLVTIDTTFQSSISFNLKLSLDLHKGDLNASLVNRMFVACVCQRIPQRETDMTSNYSINYHLRAHKRDAFIEFIKSLLLTPFVLTSRLSEAVHDEDELVNGIDAASVVNATTSSSSPAIARYLEVLACIEDLVSDHMLQTKRELPELSRLSALVPNIGKFFTPLPLREAFYELDAIRSISGRRSVPPSFNDIRHLLNLAQIRAIAPTIKLITFDGDMTLYADGADFARDSHLVDLIVKLLRARITVAIVTAAGYPRNAERYEQRLSGLLEGFRTSSLDPEALSQFYVLGGECNYLFRYDTNKQGLVYIHEETYQPERIRAWSNATARIQKLLDVAETNVRQSAAEMGLIDRVSILRKDRALGIVPKSGVTLTREQLDEFSLSAQRCLNQYQHMMLQRSLRKSIRISSSISLDQNASEPSHAKEASSNARKNHEPAKENWSNETHAAVAAAAANAISSDVDSAHQTLRADLPIPFCAFNGGSDMWVDIGNKLIGVCILQEMLGCAGHETLHVGDQFSSTGNDIATRRACCTVWITSPEETAHALVRLTETLCESGRL